MPELQISSTLKIPPFESVHDFPWHSHWSKYPFGYAFSTIDSYREKALYRVFQSLKGDLLDYGCGSKPYEELLNHVGINSWVGVDLFQRTSGEHHTSKADAFIEDGRIPYEDQRFDIILATQVFEHVMDLDEVIKELRRVLKPGGTIIATCPMTSILHELPHDYRRFTPSGMAVQAAKHGLELKRVIALGGVASTLATLTVCHLNFLRHIPLLGKPAQQLITAAINAVGQSVDFAMGKCGLDKKTICCDYLFQLT